MVLQTYPRFGYELLRFSSSNGSFWLPLPDSSVSPLFSLVCNFLYPFLFLPQISIIYPFPSLFYITSFTQLTSSGMTSIKIIHDVVIKFKFIFYVEQNLIITGFKM